MLQLLDPLVILQRLVVRERPLDEFLAGNLITFRDVTTGKFRRLNLFSKINKHSPYIYFGL
jgi:hypothetical protein